MITRGIVEEIVDKYNVKVRLPLLDGATKGSTRKTTSELRTMVICTLPRVDLNLQVGDVVFVAFEDRTETRAVILGCLFRENPTSTKASIQASTIRVENGATLPLYTQIGEVTYEEIQRLHGVRDNLQKQIDALVDRIEIIEAKLEIGG